MAGKGDKSRPLSVPYEVYADRYDSIDFSKKKPAAVKKGKKFSSGNRDHWVMIGEVDGLGYWKRRRKTKDEIGNDI